MFRAINDRYLPEKMTRYSAGLDVRSRIDIEIDPGEVTLIPTGVYLDLKSEAVIMMRGSSYIALHIRSSLAKKGLMLANSVGVIDLDYPDEISLLVYNASNESIKISDGERVGQMIVSPHLCVQRDMINAKYVDDERRGGFGSTNKSE